MNDAHQQLIFNGRIVGALLLALTLLPSIAAIVRIFQRYRRRWPFKRKWHEVVLFYNELAMLSCSILLIIGRWAWIGFAACAVMCALMLTIPCGLLKYNRREYKLQRNGLLVVLAILMGLLSTCAWTVGW